MKTKFFGKFGNIVRRAFCGMLCLVVVFQSINFASAVSESFERYKWTRIDSYNDMLSYVEDLSKTDREKITGRRLIDGNQVRNDDTGWFKALIVYYTTSGYYFISGQSSCNSGESIAASPVLSTYNFKIGEETFETRSGYFTPYIKFAGWDKDGGGPTFYLRCSNSKDEKMSSTIIVGNSSWYGVTEHAACAQQMVLTSLAEPTGHDFGRAINWSIQDKFVMKWHDNQGLFQAYYNVPNAYDRYWAYENQGYEINPVKNPSLGVSGFYLYIGISQGSTAISSLTAQAGITSTYTNITLVNGVLTIPKNSYVVLDGDENVNTGIIYVDGGILVIRGLLDTPSVANASTYAGSIHLKNGGTLIIEDNGVVASRIPQSRLIAEGGSTIVISGTYSTAGDVTLINSSLFVREGGVLLNGVSIREACEVKKVSKESVYQNSGSYLSNFVDQNYTMLGALYRSSNNMFSQYAYCHRCGFLDLQGSSYFECLGLFFNSTYGWIGGSSFNAVQACNIDSTIGDMVRNW